MRYYVLPREGINDDMSAALTRGLGLSLQDEAACERHCRRYGVTDLAAFLDELGEAQAALATARVLGATVGVDWCGRLCYDLPSVPDDGKTDEDGEGWRSDEWFAGLLGEARTA